MQLVQIKSDCSDFFKVSGSNQVGFELNIFGFQHRILLGNLEIVFRVVVRRFFEALQISGEKKRALARFF